MLRAVRPTLRAVGLLLGAATAAQAQHTVYGLRSVAGGSELFRFDSGRPESYTSIGVTGAALVRLDFRSATGVLYGYDGSRLYTVDLTTGAATPVTTVAGAAAFGGFDFDPVADRLRVTDAAGTGSLLVHPDDGSAVARGPFVYAPGDVGAGQPFQFNRFAHTNADPGTGTRLYAIDGALGRLVAIADPDAGAVTTVGNLFETTFPRELGGFDVVTVGGTHTAFLTSRNRGTGPHDVLLRVDLATGAASLVGSIGPDESRPGEWFRTLDIAVAPAAVVPEPGTLGLLGAGLAAGGAARCLTRRRTGT